MTTHAEARELATVALKRRLGVIPSPGEVKALAGVAWLETRYGAGWNGGTGEGSNNMGAIHADSSWKGATFEHKDSKPDGSTYVTRFKAYPSELDGWLDLVGEVFINRGRSSVRAAAKANDWPGVSEALFRTGYYEGMGDTEAERIAGHVKALTNAIRLGGDDTAQDLPAIMIRVENPQGTRIGTTVISDLQAPGLSILTEAYGAPVMVAYPNGWRFLKFAPDVQIAALTNHPYSLAEDEKNPAFGWKDGAFVLSLAGLVATIFYGTIAIYPQRKSAHG
jgi:hypothetical protein